jgi:hypothetical protein
VVMMNERFGMAYDDEDDFDVEDIELIELDDDDEEEPIPNPGITKYSMAWIVADAASTILHAFDHIIHNVKVDLVMRHNKVVDDEDFMGSVKAGIERL